MKPVTPTDKKVSAKYPDQFARICNYFNHENRELLAKNFRFGELSKDVKYENLYEKGTPIIFRLSNPINSEMWPLHYVLLKCADGFTPSGYHSITVTKEFIKDLTPTDNRGV